MYAYWIHLQVLYTDSVSTLAAESRETWSMSDPRTLFNFGELLEDLLTWRSHSAQAGLGPVDIWAPLKKSQWNELQSTLMLHPKKTTREMPKDLHNYLRNFPAPNFFQVFSIYKEPRSILHIDENDDEMMKWPWLLLSRRNSVLQQFFCTLIMRMPCSLFLTLRMCSLLLSSSVKNKKQLPTFFCFLPLLALIQTYSSQTYCFKELLKHKRVALGRCSHSFFSWEDFHMPRSIKICK